MYGAGGAIGVICVEQELLGQMSLLFGQTLAVLTDEPHFDPHDTLFRQGTGYIVCNQYIARRGIIPIRPPIRWQETLAHRFIIAQ